MHINESMMHINGQQMTGQDGQMFLFIQSGKPLTSIKYSQAVHNVISCEQGREPRAVIFVAQMFWAIILELPIMVAYYIRGKFYHFQQQTSTMGLSTPGRNVALAFKNHQTAMEFSTRHIVCFTPAVQAGWNQFKPVGSSLMHMTNRNSMALPHHFCFGLQQGRFFNV